MQFISKLDFELISEEISPEFGSIGLEHYPFKIGWYNDKVSADYRLPYNDDTLAFVILSTPDMFEKAFIPFIKSGHFFNNNKLNDPIDQCIRYHFNRLKMKFSSYSLETIHDFDLFRPRRPKVLVQTAAHVSGAAFYYRPDPKENLNDRSKMIGVCIHPEFGGWFAIRGVVIFSNVVFNSLEQKPPRDVVESEELKKELLKKFNTEWRDWSYRDIIPVTKKYSDLQMKYFTLKPCDRVAFLEKNIDFSHVES